MGDHAAARLLIGRTRELRRTGHQRRVGPDFASGRVDVLRGIPLINPDRHVRFPLARPVRVRTGADVDPESIVRAGDGMR